MTVFLNFPSQFSVYTNTLITLDFTDFMTWYNLVHGYYKLENFCFILQEFDQFLHVIGFHHLAGSLGLGHGRRRS
jgi:hypothetical protein